MGVGWEEEFQAPGKSNFENGQALFLEPSKQPPTIKPLSHNLPPPPVKPACVGCPSQRGKCLMIRQPNGLMEFSLEVASAAVRGLRQPFPW